MYRIQYNVSCFFTLLPITFTQLGYKPMIKVSKVVFGILWFLVNPVSTGPQGKIETGNFLLSLLTLPARLKVFEELRLLVLLPFATTQQKTAGEIRQFSFNLF